ncbi:peroxidase 42-like isoform X1 [Triticum dicoccoides]|uniref:peroxidase 42-like isoform X1 n=1 Tax=Triticum dicoccoides TaxID=85692 RepID=UPI000E79C39E|nr:peroxidase 42-like isoform X1 [Triticum dicoccoides]XP_037489498.1 peroxidase 42-like isoform X1 [Triticum dicoccoides]XP_037489503.1 peroxidase 42-like isoform X1 [Triticum dicoccoides]XP_037489510.1 peroxidase 42-like isoform X1 [Triticum dicoccoides]XP_037489517.1 peroxidase 42-like isoform X1 [Triticum dicoccoides]
MASSRAILAMGLLAAVLSPALSKRSFISMPADVSSPVTLANGLSYGYHANSCPQLQDIVWPIVESAVLVEVAIAAGLLRIFFHDCFPQGCDASVLLTGPNSERDLPPNQTLQPRAMQLIEDVRVKVHAACGATVSCADIIALATRDAVFVVRAHVGRCCCTVQRKHLPTSLAKEPMQAGESEMFYFYDLPLGRFDSLEPANSSAVFDLPQSTADADTLINAFKSRNLEPIDLVALSGAHTVGKAHCSSFNNRFSEDADFARRLAANCSSDQNRLQDLDVETPIVLDNQYFKNLMEGKGVFTSDQVLIRDGRTDWAVKGLAENKWWFYNQFRDSLVKLSQYQPGGNVGEIRRNSCFAPNGQSIPATAGDEGFAASA